MQIGDVPQIFLNLLPSSEPDWVSVTLGVFVCQGCSLIHRSIENLSQVKSVLQDTFEDKEIEVSHRRSTSRVFVFLAEGCVLLQGWMYYRNQLFLISWIPSEIDRPFAYLKDWGCKPVGLGVTCVIMLTSVSYSFNIVPVNHAVHSIPVVYHLYGEWSSKGQVRTTSSSVLSPSLPLRLQVGLKHLNTVQHRFQENTPIAVVPCWVHLQSRALRLCWCLLSCGHSDIIVSISCCIVGVFEPSEGLFSHMPRECGPVMLMFASFLFVDCVSWWVSLRPKYFFSNAM